MQKLKLYTDFNLIQAGQLHNPIFVPFTGQNNGFENDPEKNITIGRFDKYEKIGHEIFELTDIENCEACLLPIGLPNDKSEFASNGAIKSFIDKASALGKKTLIFGKPDYDVNISNSIIFHNSLYQSHRNSNEFSGSHFFEDFIEKYYDGKLSLRKKQQVPTIGFCGYAPPLSQPPGFFKIKESLRLILNYAGIVKKYPTISSHSFRARVIRGMLKNKLVHKNFIIRQNFGFGGPYGALQPGGGAKELNASFREAYVNNIMDSDYTLCVRGIKNNSIRFFETLCCGRIPILVNTDCVLPYDFEIPWEKYCLIIDEKDLDKVADKVLDFHSKLTENEFLDMQRQARWVWEEYLSPTGFFKNLYKHLNQINKV